MDDKKQTFRKLVKRFLLSVISVFIILVIYGGFIFWQTQTIEDPRKCFTTKMFKVNLCPENASYVKYQDIPKHFFHSLILSEDASFYTHKGFDWFEIKESFRRNFVEWKFTRGGSTLTQQLAKNLYLTQEKSISRKFKEFFISKQIEKRLSKSQILEKYANVVEFGNNIYGINAATIHYFSKTPSQLTILESIYLVSLLPSPKKLGNSFEKRKLSKSNLWRMGVILKRLYRTKKIKDDLFVYIKMLLEKYSWPFEEFSNDFLDLEKLSIEDEMFMELGENAFEEEEETGKTSGTQIEESPQGLEPLEGESSNEERPVVEKTLEGNDESEISDIDSREENNSSLLNISNREGNGQHDNNTPLPTQKDAPKDIPVDPI